jgi:phage terminase large subunit
MVMLMKVRLTDQINPHFRKLWNTSKPYVIAKGGAWQL